MGDSISNIKPTPLTHRPSDILLNTHDSRGSHQLKRAWKTATLLHVLQQIIVVVVFCGKQERH